jgi:hypothetical protein
MANPESREYDVNIAARENFGTMMLMANVLVTTKKKKKLISKATLNKKVKIKVKESILIIIAIYVCLL